MSDSRDLYWAKQRQLYIAKRDLIESWGCWEACPPVEYYSDMFSDRSGDLMLQDPGRMDADGLPNAIALELTGRTRTVSRGGSEVRVPEVRRHTVTSDLEGCLGRLFALGDGTPSLSHVYIAPVTYFGKRRTARNARYLHAFVIDLDGVGLRECENVLIQVDNGVFPRPTHLVSSGTGLHVVYQLADPVPLVPRNIPGLQLVKRSLTEHVWNRFTSSIDPRERQYQGIYQAYRAPGSSTNLDGFDRRGDERYACAAWRLVGSPRPTAASLARSVPADRGRCGDELAALLGSPRSAPRTSLAEAALLWPEWYERRVVRHEPRGTAGSKRALYEWWLGKVSRGATVGHRYWCLSMLAAYARKCGVGYGELERDARGLMPWFQVMGGQGDDFTEADLSAALSTYRDDRCLTYTREYVQLRSAIDCTPRVRRNGRKRDAHLKRARAVQAVDDPGGSWRNGDGAPRKNRLVYEWRRGNPGGAKSQCSRETGLSRTTVIKWWDWTPDDAPVGPQDAI